MALAADPPIPAGMLERLSRWVTASLLAAVMSLWIAMAEVDRLIAGLVNRDGLNSSIAILSGFGDWQPRDTWRIWSSVSEPHRLEVLVGIHTGADVVFAVVYAVLLVRALDGSIVLRILAVAAAAVDVAEGFLIRAGIGELVAGNAVSVAGLQAVTSNLKWLLLASVLAGSLAYPGVRASLWGRAVRFVRVLQFHRLPAATVAIIAVFALLPIPGVSDQMPDSQRIWAEDGAGLLRFGLNSLWVLLVAAALFAVARMRSVLARKLWMDGFAAIAPPSRLLWVVGPLLLLTALICVMLVAPELAGHTNWWQFSLFLTMPLGLLVVSLVIFAVLPVGSFGLSPHPMDPQRSVDMWRGGDNLAAALISVSGMALVRSFAAPVAMLALPNSDGRAAMPPWWSLSASALLVAGILLALGIFPLKSLLLHYTPGMLGPDPRREPGPGSIIARWIVLAFAASSIVLLLVLPSAFTAFLGVSATAVVGVGAWALLLGVVMVWVQERRPLEIFHVMGLRANPLLTLIAAALALGQVFGGGDFMHGPRQLPPGQAAGSARATLEFEFTRWLGQSSDCDRPGGLSGAKANRTVRPMIVLAAEGGGIRAANWTAKVLDTIAATTCGRHAILLSSGVSGGSLGLVLATKYASRDAQGPATMDVRGGPELSNVADALSAPEALAASVGGTLGSDLVGGGTGLLLPNWSHSEYGWHDRAGLMEKQWETAAPQLADRFDADVRGVAGALLLNSTVTGSGCRLVLSQVELPAAEASVADRAVSVPGCEETGGTPVTIDYFSPANGFCDSSLAWSTAAMVSARFPIISPAARLRYAGPSGSPVRSSGDAGSCNTPDAFQAIDGGYAEGSGLGTVSDLWGRLRGIVAHHNQLVDEADGDSQVPGAAFSYVVPVFAYVRNSPGADVTARVPQPIAELAVPLAGIQAKNAQSEAEAWLQRLQQSADTCLSDACRSAAAMGGLLGAARTAVVAPKSEPAIDPPLGWTLSQASRNRLDQSLDAERNCAAPPAVQSSSLGTLSLCTVLKIVGVS